MSYSDQGLGYKFECLFYACFSIIGMILVIVIRLSDRFDIFDRYVNKKVEN
jgi:hypothetical protein